MTPPVLALRNVTIRYETNAPVILSDVSFTVEAGERISLVGLNGSGKTTLLMAAVGLAPHEGQIEVCGVPLSRKTLTAVRDRIGFLFNVPEDQLLFPKVIDDVAFGLMRRGIPSSEAADKSLATLAALGVGHLAESSLHHLSHGQKQRVALAGAMVCEPPLLLLDEPSAALDPPGKRSLARLLQGQEAAMVVATHDLEFAAQLCTRFIMLEGGRIILDSAVPEEILHRWGQR
jgi:cobalt/nickel transport system ATP-binding protein